MKRESRLSQSEFSFCPILDQNDEIMFTLRTGSDLYSQLQDSGILQDIARNDAWSVERMTGMTTEEFISQITEHPDACIQLLSYSELTHMGYVF